MIRNDSYLAEGLKKNENVLESDLQKKKKLSAQFDVNMVKHAETPVCF